LGVALRPTSRGAKVATLVVYYAKPDAIRKNLDHLGIPSEPPRLTAAQPPPQAELSGKPVRAEVECADPQSPEW
jgi:hypothetical protein